ncbi:amino acid/polyamine transporter I [Umbelopsis sp. AD052]|nr:amino acid/polyamine transporter I [Umbelopsis sp. AD052]
MTSLTSHESEKNANIQHAEHTTADESHQVLNADEELLRSLGYKQMWGTAMYEAGSMAVIWGWFVTTMFTICVAVSLAEICSAYPTTGGLYFWVSRLATADWVPLACWLTGWANWMGLAFAITSVDLGLAQFIGSVINIWQPEVDTSVYMEYGIFVGILIIHGIITSVAVRWNGIMNQLSFWFNMLGILLIVIVGLALTPNKPSGSWVFTSESFANNSGFSSDGYAFLLVILQSQYTLSGYDSAAHMSEETKNSQSGSPFGMLFSVIANGVSGFIFLIGCSFMVQNFDAQITNATILPELAQVFYDGVGPAWTMVFLIFVMGSIFFSGSALTLGSSRMVYAFSRDGAMPFSKYLHSLNDKTKSPVWAVWFNIVVAGLLGLLFIINSTAYTAIVSVNTIGSQLSYFFPILLRITISRKTFVSGPWKLGVFAVPLGVISCLWLLFTCVLFILPTVAPIDAENMNYAILPFVVIMGASTLYYYLFARKWFTGPVRVVDGEQVILEEEDLDAVTAEKQHQ